MPNWCENELTITGKAADISACEAFVKGCEDGETRVFDFDKIIPMPPILKEIVCGSVTDWGLIIQGRNRKQAEYTLSYPWVKEAGVTTVEELIPFLKEKYPEAEAAGLKAVQALEETGYDGWYNWRCDMWGTKWNASSSRILDRKDRILKYGFDTAWSPPRPVIIALSEKLPGLTLTLRYWEGGGGFRGKLKVKGGEVLVDETSDYRGSRGG